MPPATAHDADSAFKVTALTLACPFHKSHQLHRHAGAILSTIDDVTTDLIPGLAGPKDGPSRIQLMKQ